MQNKAEAQPAWLQLAAWAATGALGLSWAWQNRELEGGGKAPSKNTNFDFSFDLLHTFEFDIYIEEQNKAIFNFKHPDFCQIPSFTHLPGVPSRHLPLTFQIPSRYLPDTLHTPSRQLQGHIILLDLFMVTFRFEIVILNPHFHHKNR